MIFNSFSFLGIFFPIVLLLYFSTSNRKWRNMVLAAASICFYALGQFIFGIGIIVISLIDYIAGRLICNYRDKDKKITKFLLITVIFFNLSIFVVIKYAAYSILNIDNIHIGITIFLFQAVSYIIDVYREKTPAQKNYFYLLLYISFFPQSFLGPIVKYHYFFKQIKLRKETLTSALEGFFRFFIGIIKIMLLENYLKNTVKSLLQDNLATLSASGAWIGIFLFSIYMFIYFSSYSDIAIGLANIFGFGYKENFDYPYISREMWDYWDKWNISLNSFLNEYIWQPMNKRWKVYYINTIIMFLIMGLSYGIDLNFILWSLYILIILVIEYKLSSIDVNIKNILVISNVIIIILTCFGWAIFYYKNFNDYSIFLQALLGLNNRSIIFTVTEAFEISKIFWLIPIYILLCTPLLRRIGINIYRKCKYFVHEIQFICFITVLVFAIVFSVKAFISNNRSTVGTNYSVPKFSFNSLINGSYAYDIEKIITNYAYERKELVSTIDYFNKIISNNNIVKIAQKNEKQRLVEKEQIENVKKSINAKLHEREKLINKDISIKDKKESYTNTGEYIILKDKVLQLFHYNKDNFNYSLQTYNSIMNSLPKGINKYILISPMRICFEDIEYKRHSDNLKNVIDEIYKKISSDVIKIDSYKYLESHKNEKIFLSTDYYWTSLGAYYGAKAFCDTNKIQMKNISEYELRTFKNYVGAFSYIDEAKGLVKYPEDIDYYISKDVSNTQLVYKYDKNKELITYEAPAIALSRRGYNIFIGNNVALSIIKGDKDNDKVLMIMGEGYARAFAPWLIPYYKKIVVLNPLYFKGRKPEFQNLLKNFKVTDFIILEYGNDINSRIHIDELRKSCIYNK